MKLRDDIQIHAYDPAGLKQAIEDKLNELIELGLTVELDPPNRNEYDSTCIDVVGPQYDFQDHPRGILANICEPLSAGHLSELSRLCERVTFEQGVMKLERRIADLGYIMIRNGGCRGMFGVQINESTTAYFSYDRSGLWDLQDRVETEELYRRLSEHEEDFRKAGIQVKVIEREIEIVLQENDPVLKRRLTSENVDRLITLAYVLAEYKPQVPNPNP